jgi:hypothetical protein
MPEKLPDPEAGTDEQAAPNGVIDVVVLFPVDAEDAPAAAFGFDVDMDVEPLELQAAPPSASPAAIAVTARTLTLMFLLPSGLATCVLATRCGCSGSSR